MDAEGAGGLDRIADLPDDGSREKEVYARYGLAMFHAHAFEHGLVTLIMATVTWEDHQAGTRGGAAAFEELMDDLYSRTAGTLLARLRERLCLEPRLESLLREAIEVRNRLAHRWFRENGLDFGTAEGMQRMVDDLDLAMQALEGASAHAHGLAVQTFMAMGITARDVEMVREHLSQDSQHNAP